MEVTSPAGTYLHPVEVDLLCSFAEVDPPFPLEVPSTGLDEIERAVMFAGAGRQLTERGLADEGGPLGVAEEFVYLLRSCTGALDLVLATDRPTLYAVALVHRDEALLVTQNPADPHGIVRMKSVTLDEALDDLVRLVPALDTPPAAPFSLPRRAVQRAFEAMMERMPEPDSGLEPKPLTATELDDLLRAHGIDDRVARRMLSHLQPVLGNGQAGVAVRAETEDCWARVGDELSWLDTDRGRFQLAGDGEWMSVNPLTRDELRAELRRVALTAR